MPTTPATQTIYSIVATVVTPTYVIPQWIFQKEDITVFYNDAIQDVTSYSVSGITESQFTLTLVTPPAIGVKLTVARNLEITEPENFAPGAPLTSADLNVRFDTTFIFDNDMDYYTANIYPKYNLTDVISATPLLPADLLLPQLSTPGPTDAPRVWAKDSSGAIIDAPLDPSGKSAAELETELAANTSPSASGATMIGYFSASGGSTTVQAVLDGTVATDIAYYTDTINKITVMNGAMASDGTTQWQQFQSPSVLPDYNSSSIFGDPSGTGSEKMAIGLQGTAVSIYTAGTSISGNPATAEWTQGSPNPTVPSTVNTDTTLATRGYCVGTTPTFTKEATAAAAKAAAAADTNPLHFYWSPTP